MAGGMGPENVIIAGSIHWKYPVILVDICKFQGDVLWRGKDRTVWECVDDRFDVYNQLSSGVHTGNRSRSKVCKIGVIQQEVIMPKGWAKIRVIMRITEFHGNRNKALKWLREACLGFGCSCGQLSQVDALLVGGLGDRQVFNSSNDDEWSLSEG